ncbi:Uncharacterised protein [Mycobacteroides abscessus subsp. abscessus]|nr:Uncharacterised protein [Mycobacteroides abscessus subsp. abscessus]
MIRPFSCLPVRKPFYKLNLTSMADFILDDVKPHPIVIICQPIFPVMILKEPGFICVLQFFQCVSPDFIKFSQVKCQIIASILFLGLVSQFQCGFPFSSFILI